MNTQTMYDKAQFSGRPEPALFSGRGSYDVVFYPFCNHILGTEHCLIDVFRKGVLLGTLIVSYPFRDGEPANGYGISGTGRKAATLQEGIDTIETVFYGAHNAQA